MNQLIKIEDEVRFWATEFSPKSMQLFSEYMKISQNARLFSMVIMDMRSQKVVIGTL